MWFKTKIFSTYYSDRRWDTASHLTICCHYSIWVYAHSWGCWMDSQLILFLSPIPSASSFPLATSYLYPPSQFFFPSFRFFDRDSVWHPYFIILLGKKFKDWNLVLVQTNYSVSLCGYSRLNASLSFLKKMIKVNTFPWKKNKAISRAWKDKTALPIRKDTDKAREKKDAMPCHVKKSLIPLFH